MQDVKTSNTRKAKEMLMKNVMFTTVTVGLLMSVMGNPQVSVETPPEVPTPAVLLGDELLAAVARVDLSSVQFCLAFGADANYKDDNGLTPLGEAISDIEKGPNPKIVELLLKKGADPKALWGNCGTTPFFYLVQLSTSSRAGSVVLSNQVATVRLLLKHGADPNKRQGLFRKSSLEYAAMRNGDIELVKALVEGGAVITDETVEHAKDGEVKEYLVKYKGNSVSDRQALGKRRIFLGKTSIRSMQDEQSR